MRTNHGAFVVATAGLALVVMSLMPVAAQEIQFGLPEPDVQCEVIVECATEAPRCETPAAACGLNDRQATRDELRKRLVELESQLARLQGLIAVEIEEAQIPTPPMEFLNVATSDGVPSMVFFGPEGATVATVPGGEQRCDFPGGWLTFEVPGNDGQARVQISGDCDTAAGLRESVHGILRENRTSEQLRQALSRTLANFRPSEWPVAASGTAVIVTDGGQVRMALPVPGATATASGGGECRETPRPRMRVRGASGAMRAGPRGFMARPPVPPVRALAPRPQAPRACKAVQSRKQGCCCCCCCCNAGATRTRNNVQTMTLPSTKRAQAVWPQRVWTTAGNPQGASRVQIQVRVLDEQGNVIQERTMDQPVGENPAVLDDPTN